MAILAMFVHGQDAHATFRIVRPADAAIFAFLPRQPPPIIHHVHQRRGPRLKIISYPHPTLRHPSKPLRRVDAELRNIVREMFDLMYEARGVGLAANQVDLPLRFFIVNLEAEAGKGEEMVFLNPVINRPKGQVEMEEGCLSLPQLYAKVRRPERVQISAFNLAGEEITADLEGMMARVVQHELDHLDGVLFIDRLSESAKLEIRPELEEFEEEFRSRRETGEFPSDREIAARLAEIESKYC